MTTPLPFTLTTSRLRLRRWRLDDVDAVLTYASDPLWAQHLPVPQPYERHHAEEFCARQSIADWTCEHPWAIVLDNDTPQGGINLSRERPYRAAMGYAIARPQWGQGLVAEAGRAVIDAAFTAWPELQRVYALADVRNTASLRVMEKMGMQREGVLRMHEAHGSVLVDAAYAGILRNEWETQR